MARHTMDFPAERKRSDIFRVGPKPKLLQYGADYHIGYDEKAVIHPRASFTAAKVTPREYPQSMRKGPLRVRKGPRNRVTSRKAS